MSNTNANKSEFEEIESKLIFVITFGNKSSQ